MGHTFHRILIFVIALSFPYLASSNKQYEGDFEFVDEDYKTNQTPRPEQEKWLHDPLNELCRPLNCKKHELCLLEDANTAVCVSKNDFHKTRSDKTKSQRIGAVKSNDILKNTIDDDIFYESDISEPEPSQPDYRSCKQCIVAKPKFVCASDNRTYSSLCRLDYHNCIHRTKLTVSCKGFCPCHNQLVATASEKSDRKSIQAPEISNEIDGVFTPEDIKFQNRHYKYLKYNQKSRQPKPFSQGKGSGNVQKLTGEATNSVDQECQEPQLTAIGNRLLDWFSVIMADNKQRKKFLAKPKGRFPPSCKTEARWMFGHLDLNNDGFLSTHELYDLEHDPQEKCIKSFIDSCSRKQLTGPSDWCSCFDKTDRPCTAVRRRLSNELLGSYSPACDPRGFYQPTQCHRSVNVCWCVDKHGVEFANTRTRGSKPNCEAAIKSATQTKLESLDDEDDNYEFGNQLDDDETSVEGSADRSLTF